MLETELIQQPSLNSSSNSNINPEEHIICASPANVCMEKNAEQCNATNDASVDQPSDEFVGIDWQEEEQEDAGLFDHVLVENNHSLSKEPRKSSHASKTFESRATPAVQTMKKKKKKKKKQSEQQLQSTTQKPTQNSTQPTPTSNSNDSLQEKKRALRGKISQLRSIRTGAAIRQCTDMFSKDQLSVLHKFAKKQNLKETLDKIGLDDKDLLQQVEHAKNTQNVQQLKTIASSLLKK